MLHALTPCPYASILIVARGRPVQRGYLLRLVLGDPRQRSRFIRLLPTSPVSCHGQFDLQSDEVSGAFLAGFAVPDHRRM